MVRDGFNVLAALVEAFRPEPEALLGRLSVPHAKPVVVFGDIAYVLCPSALEKIHPRVSVEIRGVEKLPQDIVKVHEFAIGARQRIGYLGSNEAVNSPMDSYPKFQVFVCLKGLLGSVMIAGIDSLGAVVLCF
jgi:hypothetical protein